MDYVDLYADGALRPAHRGLPVPVPLHAAGLGRRHEVKLTAEAVDAAGNKSTPRPATSTSLAADDAASRRRCRSPRRRSPARRSSAQHADLRQRRVPQQPGARTLRVAAQRRGHRRRHGGDVHARPRPTSAARSPAASSATNDAGTGDATLRGAVRLRRRAPAPHAGGARAVDGDRDADGRDHQGRPPSSRRPASWRATRKAITCTVRELTPTKFTGTIRLQGQQKTGSASKSGKRQGQAHAALDQGAQEGHRRWS